MNVEMRKNEENMEVEEMYTPLSEAKGEIWRRWNDNKLKKEVEGYLGEIPEVFKNEPKTSLFRYIASPNLEFLLANKTAYMAGLKLVFMEFLKDKFCTRNPDKVHLGKIRFIKNDKSKKYIMAKENIIDLEKSDNVTLCDIKTHKGESLIDFHHKLFLENYPDIELFDVSHFKSNGETSFEVYMKVFSLFITNGILLENYCINSNQDERKFTLEVVKPAFDEIRKIFGVKPLIVRLVDILEEGDMYWQCYPFDLKDKLFQ
jgi:hypothetical protein